MVPAEYSFSSCPSLGCSRCRNGIRWGGKRKRKNWEVDSRAVRFTASTWPWRVLEGRRMVCHSESRQVVSTFMLSHVTHVTAPPVLSSQLCNLSSSLQRPSVAQLLESTSTIEYQTIKYDSSTLQTHILENPKLLTRNLAERGFIQNSLRYAVV